MATGPPSAKASGGGAPKTQGGSAPLRAEDGQVRGGAVATMVAVVRIPRHSWAKATDPPLSWSARTQAPDRATGDA
jgi:hypothetical protein